MSKDNLAYDCHLNEEWCSKLESVLRKTAFGEGLNEVETDIFFTRNCDVELVDEELHEMLGLVAHQRYLLDNYGQYAEYNDFEPAYCTWRPIF